MVLIPSVLLGNTVRVAFTTRDDTATLSNPTTLQVITKSPSGIETTYTYGTNAEISNVSAGNWSFTFTPTESGEWIVQDIGSGNYNVKGELIFNVLPGNI